jgi:hypothetical protein
MMSLTDDKFKKMGTEPYGVRKITPVEDRQRYQNLTQDGLLDMINQYGVDDVNKWLWKHMKEEQNGIRTA